MITKLMTNISIDYYDFIDKESKKNNISKRELLEKIISFYIDYKKNKEIEESYNDMSKDSEYLNEMQENSFYLGNL